MWDELLMEKKSCKPIERGANKNKDPAYFQLGIWILGITNVIQVPSRGVGSGFCQLFSFIVDHLIDLKNSHVLVYFINISLFDSQLAMIS